MNTYLPKDRVYITELEVCATVVGVYMSTGGIEYKVRYFKDQVAYENYFFDFEIGTSTGKDKVFA